MNTTLVFTATYNESENIALLCRHVLGLDPSFDMLVVDDNSPDGTGRLLDELANINSRLTVVHRLEKTGLGNAHVFRYVDAFKKWRTGQRGRAFWEVVKRCFKKS